MMIGFYILAALLVYMSYKSFRGGINYLNYFRSELSKQHGGYTPFVSVVVPCKGLEVGLKENLRALLDQDYPRFEVIFVIDSDRDPAAGVIRELIGSEVKNTKLVVARRASSSSQKVENLREAVLRAASESKVFVFVDSDARPQQNWLGILVAPLQDGTVGATTGYRWFISDDPSFGSEMRSAWNASIASALGPNPKSNFCWGGSMAMRRETFERINMREKWRGTLSDDFAVTRAMKTAGLDIYFVPQALTASIGDFSLLETIEFTNRQMKITRVNAPDLWLLSFFGAIVFNAVVVSSILILLFGRSSIFDTLFALFVLAAATIFSTGKSWFRLKAVELILGNRWPQVKRQRFAQTTLWALTPALFLINCISATASRKVTWRGIRYELKSPNETVIITD